LEENESGVNDALDNRPFTNCFLLLLGVSGSLFLHNGDPQGVVGEEKPKSSYLPTTITGHQTYGFWVICFSPFSWEPTIGSHVGRATVQTFYEQQPYEAIVSFLFLPLPGGLSNPLLPNFSHPGSRFSFFFY
jgi:hypothetical protein